MKRTYCQTHGGEVEKEDTGIAQLRARSLYSTVKKYKFEPYIAWNRTDAGRKHADESERYGCMD